MLELPSSSPRAIDLYSHCALSSVVEFAPTDLEKYVFPTLGYSPKRFVRRGTAQHEHEDEEARPLNHHISAEEKLAIALEMAQAVAVMHGLAGGAVAHADVQLGQFFRGRDGRLKIVDYNRAEPLLYNRDQGGSCAWANGPPGDGTLRAPEENVDAPLTEGIDVYSLGNALYGVLTGTRVLEDVHERETRVRRVVEGAGVRIPRSYYRAPSSRLLAEAITKCWTYDAADRPSIFWLVGFLERAAADHPVVEEIWR